MKPKHFEVEPFPYAYFYFNSVKQFHRCLKKWDIDLQPSISPGKQATAVGIIGGSRMSFTAVVKGDKADVDHMPLTLVHEAVHVWQNACEQVGEDNPSAEFEAYSIEQIAENLINEWKRYE